MKKYLFLFVLTLVSASAFSQQKATFDDLVYSIEPRFTKISQLQEQFSDVATDTIIHPTRFREIYFKSIGIGFMGFTTSWADMVVVHLKETNQQSAEFHFKRNMTVNDVYKELGKPTYFIYVAAKQYAKLLYHNKAYEVYNVQLSKAISETETEDFDQVFPAIKNMKPDYLIIDLAAPSPELPGQMMVEELEKGTTEKEK